MHGCKKCRKLSGVLFLIIGIAYLLVDFGTWTFWNISWYTAVFLVIGLKTLGMTHCKECEEEAKK